MATEIAIDTYDKLAKQFRLAPIKDDAHLELAHEMIEWLMQEDLDESGEDYLDVLAGLVETYEERRFPISEASDVDVLRELMRTNGLSQNGLAKQVRIAQSTISDVLKGSRKLTKDQVIKLATFFNVDPSALLPNRTTGQGDRSSSRGGNGTGYRIAATPHS